MLQRKFIWYAFSAIALAGAFVCAAYRDTARLYEVGPFEAFYADGRNTDLLMLDATHLQEPLPEEIQVTGASATVRATKLYSNSPLTLSERAPVNAGMERWHVTWRGRTYTFAVKVLPGEKLSSEAPGLPDWMPLHAAEDRAAFRALVYRACRPHRGRYACRPSG